MSTNSICLSIFEDAISIMVQLAHATARADELTRMHSAFRSFEDLITCERNYRPSINMHMASKRELAALYDAAQAARGDSRRAYRFGSCARAGSLIDTRNYIPADNWYRLGNRITWFDRYTRQWIAYTLDGDGYQLGSASYYPRIRELLACEHAY
jgi:hypothetical protein